MKAYTDAAPETAPGGRGQRGRADEHRRVAGPRRRRDRSGGNRAGKRSPRSAPSPTTARCSISGCPTCPGSTSWSTSGRIPEALRPPGGGLHRQGAFSRGGHPAPYPGSQRGGERRRVSRAAAGRDRRSSCTGCSPTCPPDKQQMLDRLHRSDDDLVGKKVLVVDDDIRNIFALSSVLERRGMEVLTAGTGDEAIATLEGTSDVAIVLMDIMMPEMDGYQTMHAIRQMPPIPSPPHHRAHRQGDEGRPREVPGCGRLRLPGQTGEHRATLVRAADVAPPLRRRACETPRQVNILLVDDQPGQAAQLRGDAERAGREPDHRKLRTGSARASCSRTTSRSC